MLYCRQLAVVSTKSTKISLCCCASFCRQLLSELLSYLSNSELALVCARILGILNVTPNSFSDGGKFLAVDAAVKHAHKLIESGADIIDVGAESTAPGVSSVSHEEEWKRLENVLPEVVAAAHPSGVKVSIDTRHSRTAARALQCGVDIINDQGGLLDPEMASVAANSTANIIIMHHFGIPVSKSMFPVCPPDKLMSEVTDWLLARAKTLQSHGVDHKRIILDPGIGFGKTPDNSWYIVRNIGTLTSVGFAVCVGHSRKSMFSAVDIALEDRDPATAIVSSYLALHGVEYIRVHDVTLAKTAIKIASYLK